MKITLDTNILVRAHVKAHGPARRLLDQIKNKNHELVLSQAILYELEEVTKLRRIWRLSDKEVKQHVDALAELSTLVDLGSMMPLPIRDVDDWMVLRTAVIGEVDVLCTCDRDLRHPDLRSIYAATGIEVLTDVELLDRITQGQ